MSVYEQVMGIGDWELTLAPDTPREVRDLITYPSHIVIMPTRVRAEDMSWTLLPEAKFHGVVFRPGPKNVIGGPGIAAWFGNGDRYFTTGGSGNDLPRLAVVNGGLGVTLSPKLDYVVNNTPFTKGTITDPSGGVRSMAETVQWISHRELLDAVCLYFDVEWKVTPNFVLDVGPYTTLWPSVTAAITPNAAGRNIGLAGFESLIDVDTDFWNYASEIYVLSRGGVFASGGVSPFPGPTGSTLWVRAVIDAPDVPLDGQFAANRAIGLFNNANGTQTVTVSTDQYDVTGTIAVGGQVYVYSPETTLVNESFSSPIYWQGDVIYPYSFRVMSVRWPIEDGLGVLLRYHTGSGAPYTENWLDLTDYVEWEPAGTEIEVGRNVPLPIGLDRIFR